MGQGRRREVAVSLHRRSNFGALALAMSAAFTLVSPPAAGATRTHHPPANISHGATCSTRLGNSSNRLNAWLAGLHTQRGDIIQLARNQCYRTDKTIVLSGKSHVTFDGNGSTFASFRDSEMERENAHFRIQNDKYVTIKNLHILGTAHGGYFAKFEAQHGFHVVGGTGVTITQVTANAVYGDFVMLQRNVDRVPPTSITIANSRFGAGGRGAGRQELTIDDGVNVNVTHNYFGHGGRSAIDIEPVSRGSIIRNITIQRNTWGPNPTLWFANHGVEAKITGVHFLYNTLERTMTVDIVTPNGQVNRSDYQFIGNVSRVAQSKGNCERGGSMTMRIIGVSSLVVRSNTQRMQTHAGNTCQYFVDGTRIRGAVTSNALQNAWRVGRYDSASRVCEANNRVGPQNPPRQAAPQSRGTTRC
jgi:hypothetical protein